MLVTSATNSFAFGLSFVVPDFLLGSSVVVFLMSTIVLISFLSLVQWCCMQFVKLGGILLVLFAEYNGSTRRLRIDHMACLALTFFLNTIAVGVVGYCYIFDPTNTHNPAWTGVFG